MTIGSEDRWRAGARRRGSASTAIAVLPVGLLLLAGCGGRMPDDLGPRGTALADCPASPNCVSSSADSNDGEHAIAAFEIVGDADAAWRAAREAITATPRAAIETEQGDYLHAVYTSRIMRYRDDLELVLDRERNAIAVRSASRVGYGDMGVNRARVEALRETLASQGLVR